MGTTLYIATNQPLDIEMNNERRILASLVGDHESMNALCAKLKVPSLSGFQSYDSQGLAGFIDDPDELKKAIANAAPIQWLNPADALRTLTALRRHYAEARLINPRGRKPAGQREWEPIDVTQRLLAEVPHLLGCLKSGKG
jgi:hypothetical protein